LGYSKGANVFAELQVTPWVHGGVSIGWDGIGVKVGIDVGDTAYDFEIKAGWGLIPILVTGAMPAGGGQLASAQAG
jgi:hypothetical protein